MFIDRWWVTGRRVADVWVLFWALLITTGHTHTRANTHTQSVWRLHCSDHGGSKVVLFLWSAAALNTHRHTPSVNSFHQFDVFHSLHGALSSFNGMQWFEKHTLHTTWSAVCLLAEVCVCVWLFQEHKQSYRLSQWLKLHLCVCVCVCLSSVLMGNCQRFNVGWRGD